jgi:hypothetical protein
VLVVEGTVFAVDGDGHVGGQVPIKVAALINDTTGTLIASSYTDSAMKIGCIFGTGVGRTTCSLSKAPYSQLMATGMSAGRFMCAILGIDPILSTKDQNTNHATGSSH